MRKATVSLLATHFKRLDVTTIPIPFTGGRIEWCEDLFAKMLQGVDRIRAGRWPEAERVQSAHDCCLRFWEECCREMAADPFRSEAEEVCFFKFVKPRFKGQLMFYSRVGRLLGFCKKASAATVGHLLENEALDIIRFRETQEAFIEYFRSGRTEMDEEYFLRGAFRKESCTMGMYGAEMGMVAAKDGVMAQMFGYEWYEGWLKERVI